MNLVRQKLNSLRVLEAYKEENMIRLGSIIESK